MSWRRASIQSWFESPGSDSLWRRSAMKYARSRIWSAVGSTGALDPDGVGFFSANFFAAAGFFFFASEAAARGFFFDSAALTLALEDWLSDASLALFST